MRRLAVLILLAATNLAASPGAAIHFTARGVVASGFSPGAEVLFYGVGKIPLTYYSRFHTWHSTTVAERDGTAMLQSDIDIPLTSVWVVADLRSGQVTLATPRSTGVRLVPIGRSKIHGTTDTFSFDRSYLDLLYIQPGEGAWTWHAWDGGPGDEDGPNGLTTINIAKGVTLAGSGVPKIFKPGGTLVAIDSFDLTVLDAGSDILLGAQR